MVEQNFWEMLRAKHDSLTKSGTIVADYLVQHAEDAQYLSISSLAKACGVAVGSLYNYFPSKSGLLGATIESICAFAAPWGLTATTR